MDGVKRFSSGTLSLNWAPKGVLNAINLSATSPVAFRGHLNHLLGMGPGSLCDIMTGNKGQFTRKLMQILLATHWLGIYTMKDFFCEKTKQYLLLTSRHSIARVVMHDTYDYVVIFMKLGY